MDQIIFWAGRFHPVFVHLPTALLPLAALLYFLSRVERFKKLESTVTPLLLIGILGAAASVASGLSIAESGDYDSTLLDRHKWMGMASSVLGLLALFIRKQGKAKLIEAILLLAILLLITFTGHWGGMLTHGENWFSTEAPPLQNDVLDKLKTIPINNTSQARLYQDLVSPLLAAKCTKCHNARKQKGDLRLDTQEGIQAGGKHGSIIDVKKPEASDLLHRIGSTIEEKGHMPPKQEAQLNNIEMELLRWWVHSGGTFNKTVAEANPPALLTKLWNAKPVESLADWLPKNQPAPVQESVIDSIRKHGFQVIPIGQESSYLSISTLGERAIDANGWKKIIGLKNNIVDADFSYATLNPEIIDALSSFSQLRRLNLNHTNVQDDDVQKLKGCIELRLLQLIETKVTSGAVESLQAMPNLKKVFLFGTPLANDAALNKLPQADTGNFTLPKLITDTLVFTASEKGL